MDRKILRGIVVFVCIAVISGWLGVLLNWILVAPSEGESLGLTLWLVLPMLAALVIILVSKVGWKELGFMPNFKGNGKWYLACSLLSGFLTSS